MKTVASKIVVGLIKSVLLFGIYKGAGNLCKGKTVIGTEKKPPKATKVWKNNVYLGTRDYEIV